MCLGPFPNEVGAYRWYYADVSAGGRHVVVIFLVGSVFSARYSAAISRGARPSEFCAVNFALYEHGERSAWVFSEYSGFEATRNELRIGRSRLVISPGSAEFTVNERTTSGRDLTARIRLTTLCTGGDPQQLDAQGRHFWQPVMPRSLASLQLDGTEERVGLGYGDTNWGTEALGGEVPGWCWVRSHDVNATRIHYLLPHGEALKVTVSGSGTQVTREQSSELDGALTPWGLRIPRAVTLEHARLEVSALLESSPFYARFLASSGGVEALGEVADFRRFHKPWIRWMAQFRTRVEEAA